jgi:hypothetical protein
MRIAAILQMDRVNLERFEFDVEKDGDLEAGAAQAFAYFRQKDLTVALFEDRAKVLFERMPDKAPE